MGLQASQAGIKLAKAALAKMQLNQTTLAARLVVDRQLVSKFFTGKSIGDVSFANICEILNLDLQEIAEQATESQNSNNDSEIDALVQVIREQIKPIVREKCGTMKVLDMTQKIELTGERGIYTNVNILERITGRNRLEIAEILQNCGVEEFDWAGLSRVTEKRVPGLEAVEQHRKLMVL
ncbi:MAG: transcriptional regulator, partial [Phormidesmis sp. CAN_BIN44]|nr:transcriptional regulator [Phormidesmis sp. CAN_BIN44]